MLPFFFGATCVLFPFCDPVKHPAVFIPPLRLQPQLEGISLETPTPPPGLLRQAGGDMNVCFQVHVNRDPVPGDHSVISKNPKRAQKFCNYSYLKIFECHVIL